MLRGSVIWSRAKWYEQGERNTKYFLNLENHSKKKSCVRRLLNSDGVEITDVNNILEEVHSFYLVHEENKFVIFFCLER